MIFTPEELKAMEEAGTHMAEITEFVPLEAVDPVYFDKAYYLAPDKGGAKPYALLATALRESNRCALGRWAARGKQYIVMIRPVEDGLVMQQLLYAGEVRAMKDLEIPKTEVKPAELKLAQQLIEQQTSRHVRSHRNTRTTWRHASRPPCRKRSRVRRSRWPRRPKAAARQVIDLMEALRASLEKKAPARAKAPEPAPQPRAQAAEAGAAGRARGARGAQGRQEIKAGGKDAGVVRPVRRPRRRAAAAPVAQHDPLADRRRLRRAGARARAARGNSPSRT